MKCGFCGYEFDAGDAVIACQGCPLHRGCHLIRCPRCNYEMPPESRVAAWLRGLGRRKQGKGVETAKESVR